MITDKLGTEIKAGDYIAYAVREGSCYSALRVGRVLNVEEKDSPYSYRDEKVPHISVVIAETDWNQDKPKAKKTTTSIPNRAIVLHPDSVPQNYKDLLG